MKQGCVFTADLPEFETNLFAAQIDHQLTVLEGQAKPGCDL